eukprot:229709_1
MSYPKYMQFFAACTHHTHKLQSVFYLKYLLPIYSLSSQTQHQHIPFHFYFLGIFQYQPPTCSLSYSAENLRCLSVYNIHDYCSCNQYFSSVAILFPFVRFMIRP